MPLVLPNAELTGAQRKGTPPARRMGYLGAERAGALPLRVRLNDLFGPTRVIGRRRLAGESADGVAAIDWQCDPGDEVRAA
jgi:hypothetical protein